MWLQEIAAQRQVPPAQRVALYRLTEKPVDETGPAPALGADPDGRGPDRRLTPAARPAAWAVCPASQRNNCPFNTIRSVRTKSTANATLRTASNTIASPWSAAPPA